MTIAVSVKVGEGLVMAADSMSSYFNEGVQAQSYSHARKLMQLSDYPIGILTYGLGDIAGRNLESLVAEFERTLPISADRGGYSVRNVTDDLHRFIQQKYEAVFPAPAQLPLEPAVLLPIAGQVDVAYHLSRHADSGCHRLGCVSGQRDDRPFPVRGGAPSLRWTH